LRLEGRDGFSIYQGIEVQNYAEDEPAKLDKLTEWLDSADYVLMTSGRLYESIPRLPMRWPMTTRYYELMLSRPEELGYRLAGEWTSYPRIGPLVLNDDSSEEQFRVYDHPKVLIFEKLPSFDRAEVRRKLGEGIAWDKIERLWDKEATNVYNHARLSRIPVIGKPLADRLAPLPDRAGPAPRGSTAAPTAKPTLMLSATDWLAQQAGGTWSKLFNPDSPLNTNGALAVLAWLLAVELLGLAVFPIAFAVFHGLPDRGWFSSKTLGLLLASYGAWLIASVQRVVPFGRGLVWLVVVGLALIGVVGFVRLRTGLVEFVRARRSHLLLGEVVFLVLFGAFLLVRMGNPDLWHPFMGGEKPMDLAYLNAVIRTQFFPAYDPWFAGGYLNYYYYGFVMVATVVLMTGIVPATAYNLSVPLFFALTGMGAFAVVYNLAARQPAVEGAEGARRASVAPVVFGTLGALFVAVLGNLGEVKLIVEGLSRVGGATVRSNIPGVASVAGAVSGLGRLMRGEGQLGFRQEWWYWNASRAIPHPQTEAVPITEFPYFTFLYGDLHAHMLALPLTLLALALLLNAVYRHRADWRLGTSQLGWPTVIASWSILGLTIGALRPANTWDYPTYLAVGAGVFALQAYRGFGWSLRAVGELVWRSGLLLALSTVFWLPYINNFATAFSSAELWKGSRTVWWSYLMVHGFFLFTVATFLLLQVRDWYLQQVRDGQAGAAQRVIVQAMVGVGLIAAALGVLDFGSWAIGLPLVITAALLLLRRDASRTSQFLVLITAAAVSLTLLVDVVVLKGDISRMNTVFKFYLQVWVLLGVAAAAGLAWIWDHMRRDTGTLWTVWQAIFAVLFFGVSLYPVFATWGRVNDRFNKTVGATIDGMAFMDEATYSDAADGRPPATYPLKWDREAIEWLQMNVQGTPVILEGHTPEYRWGSRVSIYTGFPTVVGWSNHQRQQRSALTEPVVDQRGGDVRQIYNTPDPAQALGLMRRYDVAYVYVGPLEKAYYQPVGLAKFERMVQQGQLERVFQNAEVTIYRVVSGAPS
jgi:YYY domain-containing protein